MVPKVLNKEEKKARIAMAAVEVFGEKGFDATRMEDVARAADVGKGTIYEYFSGKKELMDGAMEALVGHMMDSLLGPLESGDDSKTAISAMTEITYATVAAMKHVADAYRFFLEYMIIASRSGDEYGGIKDMLMDFRAGLTNLLENGVEKGEIRADIDPSGTAAAFAAWFDGAIFHWMVLPDEEDLEVMAKSYVEMVTRGLVVETQPKE